MPLCSLLAGFEAECQNSSMSGGECDNHLANDKNNKYGIIFFNSSTIKWLDS
jgi:hypothetical protein